jgi:hypothetical protein
MDSPLEEADSNVRCYTLRELILKGKERHLACRRTAFLPIPLGLRRK